MLYQLSYTHHVPCLGNADHRTCSRGVLRTGHLHVWTAPIVHDEQVTTSARPHAPFARLLGAIVGLAALLAAAVVSASPASAHAKLESSSPVDGSTLTATPPEIMLRFNEPIKDGLNEVTVTSGSTDVTDGEVQVEGEAVYQPVKHTMEPGEYTVKYKVVSADGHPVSGSLSFTYDPPEGDTGAGGEPSEKSSSAKSATESPSTSESSEPSSSSTSEGRDSASEESGAEESEDSSEESGSDDSGSSDSDAAREGEDTDDTVAGLGISTPWLVAGGAGLVVLLAAAGIIARGRGREE